MARPCTQNGPGQDIKGSIKMDTTWKAKSLDGQRTPGIEQLKVSCEKCILHGGKAQRVAKGWFEWRRIVEDLFPNQEEVD